MVKTACQAMCTCNSALDVSQLDMQDEQQLERMEEAVGVLLRCIGEDPSREGLIDTPRRVSKAWMDMTTGMRQNHRHVFGSALFHEDIVAERVGGLVVVRDISFASLSNTTLLPFHGSSHIAYVPQSGVILGLSKLARVARCLASRIQSQQQFTDDLLEAVTTHVTPLGAAVIVQATHIDAVTGAEGASQFTVAASGCFNGGDSHSMEEFETLLGLSASIPKFIQQDGDTITSDIDKPTGMSSSCAISAAEKAMREAVTTLIKNTHDTGDDSKAFVEPAHNFVTWLRQATSGYAMTNRKESIDIADNSAASPGHVSPTISDTSSEELADETPGDVPQTSSNNAQVMMMSSKFVSLCEHHMLPFSGVVQIACTTSKMPKGNGHDVESVFNNIVNVYSKRLQVQERLTQQIADAALAVFGAQNVFIMIKSAHMCMVARGVEEHASTTVTTAVRGNTWVNAPSERQRVLKLLMTG